MSDMRNTPPTQPTPVTSSAEPTNEQLGYVPPQPPARNSATVAPPPRVRPKSRNVLAKILGVIGALILLAGAIYLISPNHVSHDSWTVPGNDVKNVKVDLDSGDVTISQSTDGQVHFSEDLDIKGFGYHTDHHLNGSTLEIRSGATFLVSFGHRKAQYTLALPQGVGLVYKVSAGETTINGTYGDVKLDVSAGKIKSNELKTGSINIDISAGSVELDKLTATTFDLGQSAGSTKVHFAEAPDTLKVDTSAGGVEAWLPGNEIYRVTEQHSAGDVNVDLNTASDAPHVIDIDVSAGNVNLHKA